MKNIVLVLPFFLFAVAAAAQLPPVGIVDFYGLRAVSENQARAALNVKEGDAAPRSKEEAAALEKRLTALPQIARAKISVICCDDARGKTMLYVGISEKGTRISAFRAAPNGAVRLPAEMLETGEKFFEALVRAVQQGDAEEDDSAGHSLLKNREARAFQEQFIRFSAENKPLLRKVLRESADARHRALAAQIIAYSADKRAVVADLVFAVRDADEAVRNNAVRALAVIARYAANAPEKKIAVPLAPFIGLLASLEWTDRNKASLALLSLTEKRDARMLAEIRRKALRSLVEMAQWRNPGHAFAPFFLLGRVMNLPDEEIQNLWTSGRRAELIEKAQRTEK